MSVVRFIAGSGRSGTTWIQDAIANANNLRPVFEPLHPFLSDVGDRYAHRALSAEEAHPDLESFLIRTCAGQGPRLWTQYRQQRRWLFPTAAQFSTRQDAGRVVRHWLKFFSEFPRMTRDSWRGEPLVKCIRANLMLPWIARRLDSQLVFVMRHPGAVVESELRSGWNASFVLDRFRQDARLHELTGGRYEALLARNLGPVESLTLRWVIENQWVAESAKNAGIPTFHYESLRFSDSGEWARLCSALGVATVPDTALLERPSQQSGSKRTAIPLELSKAPRWMSNLTSEQKGQVMDILEAVGLSTYSMDSSFPIRPAPVLANPNGSGAS
jgi:hypothetical protein